MIGVLNNSVLKTLLHWTVCDKTKFDSEIVFPSDEDALCFNIAIYEACDCTGQRLLTRKFFVFADASSWTVIHERLIATTIPSSRFSGALTRAPMQTQSHFRLRRLFLAFNIFVGELEDGVTVIVVAWTRDTVVPVATLLWNVSEPSLLYFANPSFE